MTDEAAEAATPQTLAAELAAEIQRRRRAAGLSQRELGQRIGYTRGYISIAERPASGIPSSPVVRALDKALNANGALVKLRSRAEAEQLKRRLVINYGIGAAATAALSPHAALNALISSETQPVLGILPGASWATAIHEAVLNPADAARRATNEGNLPDHTASRMVVDQATQLSLASDFVTLARSLPNAIGQVEATVMNRASDTPAVFQTLSDLYAVVGWTLIKADQPIGAWIAAQRAIQVAELAEDVLRTAAATRCLAEVHMRAGNHAEATRTALLAAVQLHATRPEDRHRYLTIRGAALLSAAAASARRGDRREAHAALTAAAVCADELGRDRCDLATVFGPTNVEIHRVAIAVELGDARDAVNHVPAVRLERMPKILTERRSRFLIDVARSYAQVHDDTAAIDALVDAEAIAPHEVRHHRLTRQLVPQLLTREHRSSQLRTLAKRCGLLT